MSHGESETCMDNQNPQMETRFSTELHIYEPGDEGYPSESPPAPRSEASTPPGVAPPPQKEEDSVDRAAVPQQVVLSTKSAAAKRFGTFQLIPKNLAASSRPKNRHHTTVVMFPLGPEKSSNENRSSCSSLEADARWEDCESDGEGSAFRRNRNKSYKAAVTSLDIEAMVAGRKAPATLKPVDENRASSPGPARSARRKRTLGRKRNQRGSFKDATPCLYQEIRERGLHSTSQDESLEDFVVVELPVEDQGIVVKSYKQAQLTWSQLPQVTESDILKTITPLERKRQEAIFEIITSEHSYLHSLGILVRHFKDSEALRKTMTATEHHHLFSNISVIHKISHRFFQDLEQRHNEQLMIRDISDIVQNHAAHHFDPYIVYCSNETFQQRTLQKLLNNNAAFKETLKQIESNSECGGLPMLSFLILPMQRVTRLPLLLDTICQKTPAQTAEYFSAVWALSAMSKLVTSCNDGARRMERTEQMYTIQKQMDFGKIKPFPLISSSRWLKKRGELSISSEELSIWRAFSNRSYYLFLFSDVLIITRKKTEKPNNVRSEDGFVHNTRFTVKAVTRFQVKAYEESFVVLDYATLENVEVELGEDAELRGVSPTKSNSNQLSFRLRMSKNSEGKSEQTSLVADSRLDLHDSECLAPSAGRMIAHCSLLPRVDRARWIIALRGKQTSFTCTNGSPQYEATKAYIPKEPDELSLRQAELVIVLQKEEDWCYGERMRDGERGWFPANCATEITDPTAMENNVQRMKRLRKETNV